MIVVSLLGLALAADPLLIEPESITAVKSVAFAQPFTLVESATYGMRGDHPTFSAGWLAQIEVEPGFGRSRQVDQPVLYVGAWPARVLNRGEDKTCLVVWAPASGPLADNPMFFGSKTLPERVDASRAAQELDAALSAGAVGLTPTKMGPPLVLPTVNAVWTAASELVKACD